MSFDTSQVMDMHQMFFVRSARALAPYSPESSPRIACPPFDSSERV